VEPGREFIICLFEAISEGKALRWAPWDGAGKVIVYPEKPFEQIEPFSLRRV